MCDEDLEEELSEEEQEFYDECMDGLYTAWEIIDSNEA